MPGMALTLRRRIFLTLMPLLLLLAGIGIAGIVLLFRLGNSVDAIFRENYVSVIAMERLNEAVERIDSSYQFALSGKLDQAKQQYRDNWDPYLRNLKREGENITLPGEGVKYNELERVTAAYKKQGDEFYAIAPGDRRHNRPITAPPGSWTSSSTSTRLRRDFAAQPGEHGTRQRRARHLARISSIGFGVALAAAFVLAGIAVLQTVRTILRPIQAMTHAALGIAREI